VSSVEAYVAGWTVAWVDPLIDPSRRSMGCGSAPTAADRASAGAVVAAVAGAAVIGGGISAYGASQQDRQLTPAEKAYLRRSGSFADRPTASSG
jgi:hypothetical protein